MTDDQKKGFLEWLACHSRNDPIVSDNDLTACLRNWFDSLPDDRLIYELSLLLGEISWWQRKSSYEISLLSVKRNIEGSTVDDSHQFLE